MVLFAVALLLAGCGGASAPERAAVPGVAPPPSQGAAKPLVTRIAGTNRSAQQVATAALAAPDAAGPTPEVQPLPRRAFARPIAMWRAQGVQQARATAAAVARLRADLAAGDRAAAQREWTAADAHFIRIGAAYGALGALGEAIAGQPGQLPGGVHDPHFTGLHRIERGLWTRAPLGGLVAPARGLAADVARLPRRIRRMSVRPLDIATRAHEILEDAQRDDLDGGAEPWSGGGLRATAAALAATRALIEDLRPIMQGRGEALEPVQWDLGLVARDLAALRRRHGGTLPRLDALARAERERVNGHVGALLEALAAVPGVLETRLPPAIPGIPRGGA